MEEQGLFGAREEGLRGKIIRGVGGFYYVYCSQNGRIYQCRARGLFRLTGTKPLVGDDVVFFETMDTDIENSGQIGEVLERRNALIRPEAANVDQALIFFALKNPDPSFLLLDRLLIFLALQNVPAMIAFNKADLFPEGKEEIRRAYAGCGAPLLFVSNHTGEGMEELRAGLKGRTTILAGPSGAGKSTLTNLLLGEGRMEVGELSRKTRRGRQTTRHTELSPLPGGGFLLDTPGFSSLSVFGLKRNELGSYYPEFSPYLGKCYYGDCVHMREPDCAVRGAVKEEKIPKLRYMNYKQLFEEIP